MDKKFDGDRISTNCVYTEDSKKEVADLLNKRSYYVGVSGKMSFSFRDDVIDLVLAYMCT